MYVNKFLQHDVTIATLLIALEADAEIIGDADPQYGASVTFELYRIQNEPYIKLLYSNTYSEEPQSVTHFIPGCPSASVFCPLASFLDSRKHLLPSDIEQECGLEIRQRRQSSGGAGMFC
ncbi:unnamed protein product [Gongylonema pulchrum]|uniref:Uncharacterized protein n=1 Tax=Gongylonema pulchrum TaxID=637853 RepID=A0A3P6PZI3_9BILA|nr:unnamed protein product [Gongylonema pulchrum]